jgi:hypothetical protein
MVIIITLLGGQLGVMPRLRSGGSTQVDLSQCMDKNNYYHTFKTQLESEPKVRLRSRVRRIYPDLQKKKKKNSRRTCFDHFFLKSTCF